MEALIWQVGSLSAALRARALVPYEEAKLARQRWHEQQEKNKRGVQVTERGSPQAFRRQGSFTKRIPPVEKFITALEEEEGAEASLPEVFQLRWTKGIAGQFPGKLYVIRKPRQTHEI